ncbi:hypothetical protein PMAYCL1PPCAC_13919, partial [Pristionchus mayeri]
MFELLKCIHITIVHLAEHGESPSNSLSIITESRKRAIAFKYQSDDPLVSHFLSVLKVMSLILKSAQYSKIKGALETVDSELSNRRRFENSNELSIRYLMFGIVECVHLTLLHLTKKRNQTNSMEFKDAERFQLPLFRPILHCKWGQLKALEILHLKII